MTRGVDRSSGSLPSNREYDGAVSRNQHHSGYRYLDNSDSSLLQSTSILAQ